MPTSWSPFSWPPSKKNPTPPACFPIADDVIHGFFFFYKSLAKDHDPSFPDTVTTTDSHKVVAIIAQKTPTVKQSILLLKCLYVGVYQTHDPSYHKLTKHFNVSNILPQSYLLVCVTWNPQVSRYSYLYAMANIIQHRVVYRFSNIPYRTFHVRWRYNFVSSRCVLIGRQNAYLSASDLFFMDVHSLD